MPVHKNIPELPANVRGLVDALAREIERDSAESTDASLPVIIENYEMDSDRFAVTVVWEAWKDIDLRMRGRLIMDAYKQAGGEPRMLLINRALGLTAAEAERLGITV